MPKLFFAFIFCFLILISTLFARHQSQKQQATQTIAKAILPDFSLPDISGTQHAIDDWQGKILIINFWATWCPPCLKEIPGFISLQKEYADKNVQFIGIAIDQNEPVADYIKMVNINYPILVAAENGTELVVKLGNTMKVVPYTLIVNSNSQIVYQHPGELSPQELRAHIEPLITLK